MVTVVAVLCMCRKSNKSAQMGTDDGFPEKNKAYEYMMILPVSDMSLGFYKGSACTLYTLHGNTQVCYVLPPWDSKALLPTLLHVLPVYPSEQRQVLLSTQAPFWHGGLHTTVTESFIRKTKSLSRCTRHATT